MIALISATSSIGKSIEIECRLVVGRGRREQGMGSNCLKGTAFPFGERKMFWN